MRWVRTAEDKLAADFAAGIPIQVKAEDRFVDFALSDHIVKNRRHVINGDVGVTHAEDAVKLCGHEGHSGFAHSLGKDLILHVDAGDVDDVLREETRETPRAVANFEFRPIRLISGRRGRVVLVVEQTSDVRVVAFLTRHPQVARARIEDDKEALRRRPD